MPRRTVATLVATALTASMLVASASAASAAAPGAPELLPTTTDSDGDTRLGWSSAAGASGYRLQVATDPSFASGSVLRTVDTYNRTWVPTSTLNTGSDERTLWFRVAAFGSGLTSTTLGTFSEPEPFDVPAQGTAALLSPGSAAGGTVTYPDPVVFRWTAVAGAQRYVLQYSSDPQFAGATTVTKETTGTSFAPTAPLARETAGGAQITWYWHVKAVLFDSTSTGATDAPYSATSRFTVQWPVGAARPELLYPANWTPGSPALSDIRLQWRPVAGAVRYDVVMGTARSGDGSAVESKIAEASGSTTATTWVPTIAFRDQNLYWQVVPYDRSGNAGTASEVRQLRKAWGAQTGPETAPDAPITAPVPLVGGSEAAPAQLSLDDFLLEWEPVARATFYEVQVVPHDGTARLTCQTASTRATIVGVNMAGEGAPGALKGAGKCLWSSEPAKRIRPGETYTWRVRAIDYTGSAITALTADQPVGTLTSEWSDPEIAGQTARERWITVTDRRATNLAVAEPDGVAWDAHLAATSDGQPAPLFSWNPVSWTDNDGVEQFPDGYEVIVALNASMTTPVAYARTPSTRLNLTGVFKDNETGLPYFWAVRPFTTKDDSWGTITHVAPRSAGAPSWTKSSVQTELSAAPEPGPDGTTVLAWRPQAETAPGDGGSRGYQVTIQQSNGTVVGQPAKVEYPSFVAANPKTKAPLPDGTYKLVVQPLDANGDPGRAAPAQTFKVEAARPTAQAAVVDASSAVLSWSTQGPAARFEVRYWNVATPSTVVTVGGTTLTQTAVVLSDLAPGTYAWTATAVDSADNASRPSVEQTFTVQRRDPVLGTSVDAVLSSGSRVLDWAPVAGASRYAVQLATASGTLADSAIYETRSTSFAPTTKLEYGSPYYWRVVALPEKYQTATKVSSRITLGESSHRTVWVTTTPAAPAIGTPATSGTGLVVSWPALTGAAAGSATPPTYVVRYRVKATPELAWTELAPTAATNVSLSGLAKSTTYQVEVAAQNAEGRGPWSATREKATATTPGSPGTLRLTAKLGSLGATWSRPASGGSELTKVVLRYRPTTSTTWKSVNLAATATSYTLTGLPATRYRVEVYGVNTVGNGQVSAAEQVAYGLASAPTGLKVTRGDRSAAVSWSAPSTLGGATLSAYAVQARSYNAGSKTWSSWSTKSSTTSRAVTVTGLANGTRYEFRVRAKTSVGEGAASVSVAVVPAGKPKAPTSVKASSPKKRAVKVSWAKSAANGSAVTKYVVQYSTNGSTFRTLKTVSGSTTSYTWTGATSKKKYYVRVYAVNAVGKSPVSTKVSVTAR